MIHHSAATGPVVSGHSSLSDDRGSFEGDEHVTPWLRTGSKNDKQSLV